MGTIKAIFFVIFAVVFFISLLGVNSLYVATLSLDYDNLNKELLPVVKDLVKDQFNLTSVIEEEHMQLIEEYCLNETEFEEYKGYIFEKANFTLNVSCDTLNGGVDAMVDNTIDNLVYDSYYKDYDCELWKECFAKEEIPLFLVSQKTHDYFQNKFYLSLVLSALILILMFLTIENKENLPIVAGILIVVAAIPFAKLGWFVGLGANIGEYLKFFDIIFKQSYSVFIKMLIFGAIVAGIGLIIKFFVIGFKVNGFFSKFGKKEGKIMKGSSGKNALPGKNK